MITNKFLNNGCLCINMNLYQNKEWLENQYINLKKTTREIAKICNCNKCTISNWLRKLGIPIRTRSEALKGRKANIGSFQKGHKHSKEILEKIEKTWFKNRDIGYWKGKKKSKEHLQKLSDSHKGLNVGEKHWNWKGDKVGYIPLHNWIRRYKPKPDVCEICGKEKDKYGKTRLELSNISGEYKRDINDFQWVHHSCHRIYDLENKTHSKKGEMVWG